MLSLPAGRLSLVLLCVLLSPARAAAAVFDVGPGRAYASIVSVPWEALQAGDTVLIHWRSSPYKEKFVIARQGTAAAPIVIRGVLGPSGERPVIDGDGATTRTSLNYWNETRGVIKIGGANIPPDTTPRHIVIENLDVKSSRPPYTFTSANGSTLTYTDNASPIYVEKVENLTIRNCILRDGGNGFFVSSNESIASRNILMEGNYFYDNGIVGSIFHHNNYTAAIGITFQFNRFGPLRAGCLGNNLKDRSAGLVVRYNWIESGNRQLDLVDGEDTSLIRNDPSYRSTFVYGNILVEPDGAGNRQIVHYGGDSGNTAIYRKGTLYFFNNTIVSTRTDRTTILRLSTNDERCDYRNNLAYVTAAGNTLALLDDTGVVEMWNNWFKTGWLLNFFGMSGTVYSSGTALSGATAGFVDLAGQDFRLAAGSQCVDAATALHPAAIPSHELGFEYAKHQAGVPRAVVGPLDIGAFELGSGTISACDVNRDGRLDVLDLQRVINAILSGSNTGAEDANRDGRTDVLDLQFVVNAILGVQSCP